jgi:hypothetical protein
MDGGGTPMSGSGVRLPRSLIGDETGGSGLNGSCMLALFATVDLGFRENHRGSSVKLNRA